MNAVKLRIIAKYIYKNKTMIKKLFDMIDDSTTMPLKIVIVEGQWRILGIVHRKHLRISRKFVYMYNSSSNISESVELLNHVWPHSEET